MVTATMVVMGSIARAWQTQSAEMVVMLALVWGGALCCMEDRLETLRPKPSGVGMAVAALLLLIAQWRQERLIQPQSIMKVLPLVQGLGLVFLAVPIKRWNVWRDPLLVLALLPLSRALQALIPVEALSRLTCRLCQALFLSLGIDAAVDGNQLVLSGGSVSVFGSCSGTEMVAQLVVVAGIFSLVFPLGESRKRWLAMLLAMAVSPLFALLANTLRISLLAVINGSTWSHKQWWFDFFHEGEGGLVFSLLAVMVFAPTYFRVQDHLIEHHHG
jgi:exosortase